MIFATLLATFKLKSGTNLFMNISVTKLPKKNDYIEHPAYYIDIQHHFNSPQVEPQS